MPIIPSSVAVFGAAVAAVAAITLWIAAPVDAAVCDRVADLVGAAVRGLARVGVRPALVVDRVVFESLGACTRGFSVDHLAVGAVSALLTVAGLVLDAGRTDRMKTRVARAGGFPSLRGARPVSRACHSVAWVGGIFHTRGPVCVETRVAAASGGASLNLACSVSRTRHAVAKR